MIARVFSRRTNATPNDTLTFFGDPPGLFMNGFTEIHISVTFSYDLKEAERLKKEWSKHGPVKIGGPATGMRGENFVPGMYLKKGYVITSRGCRNHCWFCSVWKREGDIRELEIKKGNNILDDNLLACSDIHIKKVFNMLKEQPFLYYGIRKQFTGGLEAALLKKWQVKELREIKPKQLFFAYDTPDDKEPLFEAGKLLKQVGFTYSHLRCYCLIGYQKDTFEKAEKRLWDCVRAGFIPMAMLYVDERGNKNLDWLKFQSLWVRPAIIKARMKKVKL